MNKAAIALVALGFGLTSGCINRETNLYEVLLSGQIDVAQGQPNNGQVHVEYHHALSVGDGELTYPLGEFDREILSAIGPTSKTLLVPKDDGAGLIVYGWLDADGDGVLCGPDKPRTELAGLVQISGYPAHSLSYSLVLDTPCVGPELLYP